MSWLRKNWIGTLGIIGLLVGVCTILLAFFASLRWNSYGYVFMPDEVAVQGGSYAMLLSGDREPCMLFTGMSLVRLKEENGYLLVQVRHPTAGIKNPYACPDGTETVMSSDWFWQYIWEFKNGQKLMEEEIRLDDADRRLRDSK